MASTGPSFWLDLSIERNFVKRILLKGNKKMEARTNRNNLSQPADNIEEAFF